MGMKVTCMLTIFGMCFSIGNFDERSHGIKKRAVINPHELTDIQKGLIVDIHNELRRIVDPSAADMLYMSWHNGLEKLATEYTRQCLFEHNGDRKLEGFSYVGENLHVSKGHKISDDYGAGAVVSWDSEKAHYTYGTRSCAAGKVCGHYTQTAWAKSYKVGCGMTTCDRVNVFGNIWEDATLFACNYAPGGNYGGQAIYTEGTPCSKCPKGDICVDELCTNSTRDSSAARSIGLGSSWKYVVILGGVLHYGLRVSAN